MFIPLFDNLPRILIEKPWINWAGITLCVLVFALEFFLPEEIMSQMIFALGIIPDVLVGNAERADAINWVSPYLNLVTYNFLHADFMHLAGNMIFLWVFGDNVEDAMGHRRYFLFLAACGAAAGLGQAILSPGSQLPIIGASGAISGILGAYLLQYPRAKVLVPIFTIPVFVRAYLLLIFWIGFQIVSALIAVENHETGVAWWAHIIGFFSGMALLPLFRHSSLPLLSPEELPRGLSIRKTGYDQK
ncbi:rhomboid family intramembrane serine protease [Kiloniella laminariae]|uniref:rhomboid family intramembrane serine protease n=1 Tax=Kiloniella laminariae TaxID=454162 RepID=UPI00035D36A9|nr:rhomboid family intramembrane serine protease [Kiloniella laminariae]